MVVLVKSVEERTGQKKKFLQELEGRASEKGWHEYGGE